MPATSMDQRLKGQGDKVRAMRRWHFASDDDFEPYLSTTHRERNRNKQ
uniref:Uncharacterized protein n=1 Tax=Prolemur simus TaxID=1328070 RepID=A0A8C9DJ76_PROSS